MDGLTAYQRTGGFQSAQLVPDLAAWLPTPTDGGTTYTFQLRRGIRYSNGAPVRPRFPVRWSGLPCAPAPLGLRSPSA